MTVATLRGCSLLLTVAVAVAAPMTAQSFVVDGSGGPGANFTTINAAVAAVPDQSLLRIRAGTYVESVLVVGKSLTIVSDGAATIEAPTGLPALHVVGLGAGQTFVMRGMDVRGTAQAGEIRLEFNQGLVMIDSIPNASWPPPRRLQARFSDSLLIARCQITDGLGLDNCRAVFDSCLLIDIAITGGDVQLSSCQTNGRFGVLQPGGPAINLQGGSVRALGGSVQGGQSVVGALGPAVLGTGVLRLSPSVVVAGSNPPIAPGVVATTLTMPQIATSWITGSVYSVYTTGTPGELGLVLGSVRSVSLPVPGLDALWLDAPTARLEVAGVFGAGSLSRLVTLPSSPTLSGQSIVWQTVSFGPTGSLALGNPTWLMVP